MQHRAHFCAGVLRNVNSLATKLLGLDPPQIEQ